MSLRRYVKPSLRTCLLAVAIALPHLQASSQQLSPQEQAMLQIINALQTGTENPAGYSPQLWQLIALQTGNTGMYVGLRQLGIPTAIHMTRVIQLPAGYYYIFRTQFQAGTLDWQVVADFYGKLWGLQFQPADIGPQVPQNSPTNPPTSDDDSNPAPSTPSLPTGGKKNKDKPKTVDDACKLYPNLC